MNVARRIGLVVVAAGVEAAAPAVALVLTQNFLKDVSSTALISLGDILHLLSAAVGMGRSVSLMVTAPLS